MNKPVQMGTEIILSSEIANRRLINVPPDVKRWKMCECEGWHYPVLFLIYPDRTEWRVLCPVGDDCMEPGFILVRNKRGTP